MSNKIKKTKLHKLPDFDYKVRLTTMKDRDKCVKRIERVVRSSLEYRDLIFFLKNYVDFNHCTFYKSIGLDANSKSSIEIHHAPFTLYDIADTVLQKYLDKGIPVNELYIAEEVMELHYKNMVGLIPLSKTIHQAIHSSEKRGDYKFFTPINLVYGDYNKFIEEYAEYIDDPIYERVNARIEVCKNLTPESFDALTTLFEYLNVDGQDDLEMIEDESEKEEINVA